MARSFSLHAPKPRGMVARAIVVALAASIAGTALVAAAENGPDWLTVDSWGAGAVSPTTVRLSVATDAAIPRQPNEFINDNLIVGFAWADLDTGTALVATIHPVIGRDSNQRPDAWHLHTVELGSGATDPNDFCLLSVASTPTAGIRIQGNTMTIDIAASRLPAANSGPISVNDFDTAVGFTVHSDNACGTGLGVRLRY